MAASGPLGANLQAMKQMFEAGAAAVVTKTITPEPDQSSGGCIQFGDQMFNREGYSQRSLPEWEAELDQLRGSRIIANIFAQTPNELAALAKRMVDCGVEVLELGLSCTTVRQDPVCCDLEKLFLFCKTVRSAVDIPVLVKLQLQTSTKQNCDMVKTIERTGINGVSFADTVPAVFLHPGDGTLILGGSGGLSGPFLKPLVLKALYDISFSKLTVVGIGGIREAGDVLDYLRMGASAVQVCTFVLKEGHEAFKRLVADFSNLMLNFDHRIETLLKTEVKN